MASGRRTSPPKVACEAVKVWLRHFLICGKRKESHFKFEPLPEHFFCSPAVRVLPALLCGPLYEVREVRLARHEEHDAAARRQVRQEVECLAQVQSRLVQVEDGSVEAPAKEELAHPGVNCAISVALERRGIFASKAGTAFSSILS